MCENCKKYLTEFIGAFFLVLTVVSTGLSGVESFAAPLAIGSALMVTVYAGGHISGGHYNPAVSLAAAIRGALPWKQFVPYSIVQIAGGALAVLLFMWMAKDQYLLAETTYFDVKSVLIAEILFTFALCYVVLHTATSKKTEGNSYYGLAIGFTVLVGAYAVGGTYCAGAFNPAVAVSVGIVKVIPWDLVGYTVLADLVGAACAAGVFKLQEKED